MGKLKPGDLLTGSSMRRCPDEADAIVNVSGGPIPYTSAAPGLRLPVGYLCLRNLRPPHPGDPGKGGGGIIVGDCVNVDSAKLVTEVPCNGSGEKSADYKVTEITDLIATGDCPKGKGRISFKPRNEYIRSYCAKRL
ncbi:hypothetical protein ACRYCC_05065 [Actinomadura scrupuli]|uniref:hypothetical protein n=1 Tax=Actinomadura scrupuli TaxID=559629 RepID=UPI003D996B8A